MTCLAAIIRSTPASLLPDMIRERTRRVQTPLPKIPLNAALVAVLELKMAGDDIQVFVPLLQTGVLMHIARGATIRSFLCQTLGIDPDFVEQRISTIFLNGRPVDNLEAKLRQGYTLALSAAMPGLVGATMRRGGVVATLRSNISHREEGRRDEEDLEGIILVKLFNTLIPELGPVLLKRGVLVEWDTLKDFLRVPGFWERCQGVTLNGEEIDPAQGSGLPWPAAATWIELRVG